MQLLALVCFVFATFHNVFSQGAPLAFGRNIRATGYGNPGQTGGYRPGAIPVPYVGGQPGGQYGAGQYGAGQYGSLQGGQYGSLQGGQYGSLQGGQYGGSLLGGQENGAPAVLPVAPSGVNFDGSGQGAIAGIAGVAGGKTPSKVHVVEARQEGPQVIRVEQHQAPDQVIRVVEGQRPAPEVHTVVEPPEPRKVIRVVSKPGSPPHIVRVVHPAPEPQVYTVVKDGGPAAKIINVIKAPELPPYVEFVKDYDSVPEITVHSLPGNPQVYDERLVAPGVGIGPLGGVKVISEGYIIIPCPEDERGLLTSDYLSDFLNHDHVYLFGGDKKKKRKKAAAAA